MTEINNVYSDSIPDRKKQRNKSMSYATGGYINVHSVVDYRCTYTSDVSVKKKKSSDWNIRTKDQIEDMVEFESMLFAEKGESN